MDSNEGFEANEPTSSVIHKKTQQIIAMLSESKRKFNSVTSSNLFNKNETPDLVTNRNSPDFVTIEGIQGLNTTIIDDPEMKGDLEEYPIGGYTELAPKVVEGTQGVRENYSEVSSLKREECYGFCLPNDLVNEIQTIGGATPAAIMGESVGKGVTTAPENKNLECTKGVCENITGRKIQTHSSSFLHATTSTTMEEKETSGKTYASVVNKESTQKLSAKSNLEMKYFPFTRDTETPTICLRPDPDAIVRWSNCIVGYFLRGRLPYYVMRDEAFKMWGNEGLQRMTCTDTGFFFFEFGNGESRDKVLENGMMYILGKALIIKKWHLMLSLTKEAMAKIPIWVKFHNLPYEFWSAENLSKVASIVGRPLYADKATEQMARVTYARVCIEVDASEEKLKVINVNCDDQNVEVYVEYQWYPPKCCACNVFGHTDNMCISRPNLPSGTNAIVKDHKPSYKNKSKEEWVQVKRHKNASKEFQKPYREVWQKTEFPKYDHMVAETGRARHEKKKILISKYGEKTYASDLQNKNAKEKNFAECKSVEEAVYIASKGGEFASTVRESAHTLAEGKNVENLNFARNAKMDGVLSSVEGSQSRIKSKGDLLCERLENSKGSDFSQPTDIVSKSVGYANLTKQAGDIKSTKVHIAIEDNNEKEGSVLGENLNGVSNEENPKTSLQRALDRLYVMQKTEIQSYGCGSDVQLEREKDLVLDLYTGENRMKEGKVVPAAFELENVEDCLDTPTATKGIKLGLSYSDYPSGMSKKKKKKLMSAAMKAKVSKKIMDEPPLRVES